jgi:hypothetical protein
MIPMPIRRSSSNTPRNRPATLLSKVTRTRTPSSKLATAHRLRAASSTARPQLRYHITILTLGVNSTYSDAAEDTRPVHLTHYHLSDYQQYPSAPPANQFPQQGPYHHDQAPYDPNNPNPYGQAPPAGGYGATDPNAQAEGDRGLMGALAGGVAGHYGGNKFGGHGIIGAIAGAVAGSKLEDKFKANKHSGQGGSHGGY